MSVFKDSRWSPALGWGLILLSVWMALFWFNSPWLKLPLLMGATGAVGWLVWKEIRIVRVPMEFWCYFLYVFGAVGCVLAFFPPPEMVWQATPDGPSWGGLPLGVGLGLIATGAVLHALLALRGHAGNEKLRKWAPLLAGTIAATLLIALLERHGLGHWLLYVPLALLGLLFLAIAWLFLSVWRTPVNRIARFLNAQKYREAIQYGEPLTTKVHEPGFQFNLATAYELAGETSKARSVFEQLKSRSDLPAQMIEIVDQRLTKMNGLDQSQPS
jgi:hypothetical protein